MPSPEGYWLVPVLLVVVGLVQSPSKRLPEASSIGLLPAAFNSSSSLSSGMAAGSVQVAVKVAAL